MDVKVTNMRHVIAAFSLTADAPGHGMICTIVKKPATCFDPILYVRRQSGSSGKCIYRTQ